MTETVYVPSGMGAISSVMVVTGEVHDRVRIYNRGGMAGEVVVVAGDGHEVAQRLAGLEREGEGEPPAPVPTSPAPEARRLGRLEHAVVERIRILEAAWRSDVPLKVEIERDLILPNVALLAQFCSNVTLEGGSHVALRRPVEVGDSNVTLEDDYLSGD